MPQGQTKLASNCDSGVYMVRGNSTNKETGVAQKTQVVLIDDLTGDILSDGQGQTVSFALDGTSYEIDLNKKNADALRKDLRRYVDAARKLGRAGSASRRSAGGGRQDTAAIRDWARQNGHAVNERGRIPSSIVEAYQSAH